MNKILFLAILFFLIFSSMFDVQAQNLSTTSSSSSTFDMTGFPQWAKDIRRFDIVAFGSFPFSMFFVSFTMDMFRWNDANGLDMSEQGRRYAPWPLKSAGAYEMTNREYGNTILLAAGVSVGIAFLDMFIVNAKRNKERRRLESLPSGSYEIDVVPYGEQEQEEAEE